MSLIKDFTIPADQAAEWTARWREKNPEAKAFLIPVEDLFGVLQEMNVLAPTGAPNEFVYNPGIERDVRGYMGIDENGTPHMVMVGTKRFPDERMPGGVVYRDLYNGGVDGKKDTLEGAEVFEGSGVYDFSSPCPTVCDDESELNGGG